MNRHWTEEELIGSLYGAGPTDGHLDHCGECRRGFADLRQRRALVLEQPPEVTDEFLSAQRRAIYQRLEQPARPVWNSMLSPVFGVAAAVVLALVVSRPAPEPEPTLASSDAQFYQEIYSVLESNEPRAATPIHGLFQE